MATFDTKKVFRPVFGPLKSHPLITIAGVAFLAALFFLDNGKVDILEYPVPVAIIAAIMATFFVRLHLQEEKKDAGLRV